MLQEGKLHTGIGWQRGWHGFSIFEEIHNAGGGVRKMFTSVDGFLARTLAYTTARVWGFCYFYDWVNPDPRRTARTDFYIMAGCAGGFVAGVAANPIELVFNRMQADAMYPNGYKRNYKNIVDGLMRATDEGVLMRGSVANGLKLAALCASMTNSYDWCKENSYYFLGPSWINRFWATGVAAGLGTAFALPFDAIRQRMHTMRPLPDGRMPYKNSFDCMNKMLHYEGNYKHQSNLNTFYAGGQAFAVRLFAICWVSQYLLDYYHGGNNTSEFWQPARFKTQTGIDYDVHEPFTDGFNKMMNSKWSVVQGDPAHHPDYKSKHVAV
jgi:hypothetical protein